MRPAVRASLQTIRPRGNNGPVSVTPRGNAFLGRCALRCMPMALRCLCWPRRHARRLRSAWRALHAPCQASCCKLRTVCCELHAAQHTRQVHVCGLPRCMLRVA
jgi:hypothetical protein